jgi:23S rRNA (cytidine1920-2'-O)/16S rRNA (cytidine1409-2'-O)-methyltransferase
VGGAPAPKPSRLVAAGEPVELLGPGPRFVSRGGGKLDAGLDRFGVDVGRRRAIDVGASTGGFTDCLLQRGAAGVVALDVGHGQLHERLRRDPRVTVVERVNVRDVDPADLGGRADLVVADLSFISLQTVADALLDLARPGADLVLLVKPEFEAGRSTVSRGRGVVRDPAVWRGVLEDVVAAFSTRGATIIGCMASPIRGADGNVEFLLHLAAPGGGDRPATAPVDLDAVVGALR